MKLKIAGLLFIHFILIYPGLIIVFAFSTHPSDPLPAMPRFSIKNYMAMLKGSRAWAGS